MFSISRDTQTDRNVLLFSFCSFAVEKIVQLINKSLDKGTVDETHTLLQKPEGKFPKVLNRSAFLYHDELRKVKQQTLRASVVF